MRSESFTRLKTLVVGGVFRGLPRRFRKRFIRDLGGLILSLTFSMTSSNIQGDFLIGILLSNLQLDILGDRRLSRKGEIHTGLAELHMI